MGTPHHLTQYQWVHWGGGRSRVAWASPADPHTQSGQAAHLDPRLVLGEQGAGEQLPQRLSHGQNHGEGTISTELNVAGRGVATLHTARVELEP